MPCVGISVNNYFGRIYRAHYLSGIVARMYTKSNKIGYMATLDFFNAEVIGDIDAFMFGIYSVNLRAEVYVKVTNSWFDPQAEEEAANINDPYFKSH